MKKDIVILAQFALILILLGLLLLCARTGDGYIVWDFGGYNSNDGLFLCPASGHYDPKTGDWVRDWLNPLYQIFPDLFIDC